MVALYLGEVYQEAEVSCWVVVVPWGAFPWEGNEAVFLVVPSKQRDSKRYRCIRLDLTLPKTFNNVFWLFSPV